MQQPGFRFNVWQVLAALALVALVCVGVREHNAPRTGVALIAVCVAVLTYKRYTETMTRRHAAGLCTSTPKRAGVLLASLALAATIIGLADLVFVVTICVYVDANARADAEYFANLHNAQVGGAMGIAFALSVASLFRDLLWPEERNLMSAIRRSLWLWPVFLALLLLLVLAVPTIWLQWQDSR